MKILYVASEVAPFVKTGGLADVAGSLPQVLAAEGHEVKVVVPLYQGTGQQWRNQMRFVKCFYLSLAWRNAYCGVFSLQKDGVEYWFVDNEYYFMRAELYGHYDDGERFAFLSRAVIELPAQMEWRPDVIHANDWQTALVPVYLLDAREQSPWLAGTRSVFTIHNIEYQGRYGDHTMEDLFGLSRAHFNERMLAYHGDVNLMKGAIYACDFLTTVSPTYAQELQYAFYAHGLEGVIADNGHKLRGILNGIDTDLYDPSKDAGLAALFSPGQMEGKAACKAALQRAVGLKADPRVPIIACVSRLVRHKGFDLLTAILGQIMDMEVQMVVLGVGDWQYEEAFRQAADQFPSRFAAHILYSGALSDCIYAGADLFLMPSVAEPCGLAQMIAMRYGTVPVVRKTGGLNDTVIPYDSETGAGRGFTFVNIDAGDLLGAIETAVGVYYERPADWEKLRHAGMTADFGWGRSAAAYLEIYHSITGIPAPAQERVAEKANKKTAAAPKKKAPAPPAQERVAEKANKKTVAAPKKKAPAPPAQERVAEKANKKTAAAPKKKAPAPPAQE